MAPIKEFSTADLNTISRINTVSNTIEKINGVLVAAGAAFTGLLDTYTNAAAAYSTRRLASSATVLMRVRRETAGGTGDDDEADVAYDSNNELSLDSAISNASVGVTATTLGEFLNVGTVGGTTYTNADSLTVTASCFVDEWKDQSGNANHATQATHTAQPQIHSGTVNTDLITENGNPALQWDGSDDILQFTTSSATTTCFIVQASSDTGGVLISDFVGERWHFILQDGDTSTNLSGFIAETATDAFGYKNGSLVATQGTNTRDQLHTALGDGNQNLTSWTDLTLGEARIYTIGRYTSGVLQYAGKVQEIVLYNTDHEANRTGIESNINSEYLIYQPTDAPTSGLLATYTGAAAAYSVRQLSDKAVIAMRIRRDSDDEERNIGFDSNGDLDTTAISDFCQTANGYVTRWWDQSTNGNHVDQPTAGGSGFQPKVYDATTGLNDENGKPALLFDTDKLGDVTVSIAQPFTSTLVMSSNGGSNTFNAVFGSADAVSVYGGFIRRTTNWWMQSNALADTGQAHDTSQHLFYSVWDGASSEFAQDGGSATTLNSGATDWTNLAIGTRGTFSASAGSNGNYQELIIWGSDQSGSGNKSAIETDIKNYFSIP